LSLVGVECGTPGSIVWAALPSRRAWPAASPGRGKEAFVPEAMALPNTQPAVACGWLGITEA